ncbi:hypothetical protein BpHYR1_005590 [Brachionus plicatilis]|uniref:Uncharacterized protein n=1 Tax=Brachionus plicatilis TaxID=10195 RepID=A0A3M7RHY9_BRAPC|nr:hypothetical protein BpHYR1_005590 [Brachionus plicatilis]
MITKLKIMFRFLFFPEFTKNKVLRLILCQEHLRFLSTFPYIKKVSIIVVGVGVGYKSRFACRMMHNAMGDDTLLGQVLSCRARH